MTARWRMVAGAALSVAAVVGSSGIAFAGAPIGPNQHFVGLVNGKHTHAVIYTVCPGPAGGGRTGPPAGGQTLAVHRVRAGGGDTGAGGTTIYAWRPGGPLTASAFTSYDTPQAILTTAQLPCDGRGSVLFTTCPLPQPCGAGSKIDSVTVTFINIAV